jgi:hypothetical protein
MVDYTSDDKSTLATPRQQPQIARFGTPRFAIRTVYV